MISPHHNFLQIDLQRLVVFEIEGASGRWLQRLVGLEGLVLSLQHLLGNLALHEVQYLLDVVVETVLQLLVMASALVRGSFPQGLRQSIENCRFPPRNLIFKILLVGLKKIKIDPVLFQSPTSSGDPFHVHGKSNFFVFVELGFERFLGARFWTFNDLSPFLFLFGDRGHQAGDVVEPCLVNISVVLHSKLIIIIKAEKQGIKPAGLSCFQAKKYCESSEIGILT